MKTKSLLKYMWADIDPMAGRNERVVVYSTKADQMANRPDLEPIRVVVIDHETFSRIIGTFLAEKE